MPLIFNKNKNVLIGGAKGVGKTTLLKQLEKENFKTIIFSDILKSSSQQKFGKKFIKLGEKERDILREETAGKILSDNKNKIILWEIHYCCYEFGKKRIVIPLNLIKKSSLFILISLEKQTLKHRRLNDSVKKRSAIEKILIRDSRTEKKAAEQISKQYKIPLQYFNNEGDRLKSFSSFREIINSIPNEK